MGAHTINRVIRLEAAGKPVAIRSRRKPDAKRVRKLFEQGLSKSAIARRLGISRTTVRALLGIERPPVPPDRAQLVRDLHAAGVIKTAIAKQARMSLTDVYRILPAPATSSKRAAAPRPQRQRKPRAMTVRRFARGPVESVREAIADGGSRAITIGKTVLIPHNEDARLLREAYLELSVQS